MVHAIHTTSTSHSIRPEYPSDQIQRTNALALSVLSSIVLLAVIPLEISIPINACLLTWAILNTCTRGADRVERVSTYRIPCATDERPRPLPPRHYFIPMPLPIFIPTPPRQLVPPPCHQIRARAGVGVRTPPKPSAPVPQHFNFNHPARAGVGRR